MNTGLELKQRIKNKNRKYKKDICKLVYSFKKASKVVPLKEARCIYYLYIYAHITKPNLQGSYSGFVSSSHIYIISHMHIIH